MLYTQFLEWCEERGLDFPCTVQQFATRVHEFLSDGTPEPAGVFEDFMQRGCGPDWRQG